MWMFSGGGYYAEGNPKKDLERVRIYIRALEEDINDVAFTASQYKKFELGEIKDSGYVQELPPREFYDMYTQLIRDLKACKKTVSVMEMKLSRVMEKEKPKHSLLDWALLVPLFEKIGWVKNGQISAGERGALREGGGQHSEGRIRW